MAVGIIVLITSVAKMAFAIKNVMYSRLLSWIAMTLQSHLQIPPQNKFEEPVF